MFSSCVDDIWYTRVLYDAQKKVLTPWRQINRKSAILVWVVNFGLFFPQIWPFSCFVVEGSLSSCRDYNHANTTTTWPGHGVGPSCSITCTNQGEKKELCRRKKSAGGQWPRTTGERHHREAGPKDAELLPALIAIFFLRYSKKNTTIDPFCQISWL